MIPAGLGAVMGANVAGAMGGAGAGAAMFNPAMLGLMGGGMALGGIGSLVGSRDQNRAARQARDWQDRRTGEGMNRFAFGTLGPSAMDLFQAGNFDTSPSDRNAALSRFQDAMGGSILDQQRALAGNIGQQQEANLAAFDAGSGGLGAFSNQINRGAARRTQNIDRLAAGAEGMFADFANRRTGEIREDAERARANADGAAMAALAGFGAGGGGTLRAQALAGNARESNRNAQRAITDVRGQEAAYGAQARNARAGLAAQRSAAEEQLLAQQFGVGAARQGSRDQLLDRNLYALAGFNEAPMQTQMQALGSQQMNPWLGGSTSQFYPGASGLAQAAGGAGTAMSGLGGQMLGAQLFQQMYGGRR